MTNPAVSRSSRQRAPKVDLRSPRVAWWTVCLFVLGAVSGVGLYAASAWGFVSPLWGVLSLSAVAFVVFTPMHDAAHRSVARSKWVNEWMGRLCAWMLLSPFVAFRYLHLEHHKHTNDAHKDPDFWSGSGPVWQLPLRWLSQDLHYYAVYLKSWSSRPVKERWETLATLVFMWGGVIALCVAGYSWPVLMFWVLPSRLGIAALAYSFDYLPHKPHHIKSSEDRYKATMIRSSPWLTPLLLYQNYHLIHHLYPGIPFYRYGEVWRAQREFLLAKGVEDRDLWGRVRRGGVEEHESCDGRREEEKLNPPA